MQNRENQELGSNWVWGIPILLLSFGLAIPHYLQDAVWFDEAYTHLYSSTGRIPSGSIIDSILLIAKTDVWPPGWYLLFMAWGKIAGRVDFSYYVLPTLIGLISISVIFRLGKSLYGDKQGITASLMLATSAIFIHYTHEIRAYTLFVLVVSVVLLYYWMLVTRKNDQVRWLRWGFSFSIGIALYVHFVAGAFLLGIIIYHLLCEHPSRSLNPYMTMKRWQDIIRLWINGCLLFSPWLAMLIGSLVAESGDSRGLPVDESAQYIIYSLSNNLSLIFLAIFLGSLLLWKMKQVRFLWIWFLGSLVAISIFHTLSGFLFHPRHVLPLIIVMILLIIPVLDKIDLRFKGLSMILIGLYAGAGIAFSMTPNFMTFISTHIAPIPLATINEMQTINEQCVQDDDAVIFSVDNAENVKVQQVMLEYYFLGEIRNFNQLGRLTTYIDETGEIVPLTSDDMRDSISDYTLAYDNVWLMHLPTLANAPSIIQFDTIMSDLAYQNCFIPSSLHSDTWLYTTADSCEAVLETCVLGE